MTLKIQPPKPLSPVLKHDPSVRQFDMDIQLLYEACRARLIPDGGNTSQVLAKKSNTDGDVEWVDQSGGGGVPPGGLTGQVLTKLSDTSGDADWADGGGVPDGGTTGQMLVKKSNTDQDTEWVGYLKTTFSGVESGPHGAASNRSTGGTFAYQQVAITFPSPFKTTEIWWDAHAGTFELTIDGTSYGTATIGATGTLVFSASAVLHGIHVMRVTKSGAVTNMRDGPEDPQNEVFKLPTNTNYGGALFTYQAPIRVKGYKSVLTEVA